MTMLREKPSRRRRKLSAIGRPEFVVQEEPLLQFVDELLPLAIRFGQEKAIAPVDPDWQGMLRMAATGSLRFVTARYDGVLVGFCANVLSLPMMYRSTPVGTTLAVYLDRSYRFGWNGYRLLRRNKRYLEQWGCRHCHISTDDPRLGKIYQRLGYCELERHYVSKINGSGFSL